jgi:hypothetical protein
MHHIAVGQGDVCKFLMYTEFLSGRRRHPHENMVCAGVDHIRSGHKILAALIEALASSVF